MRKIVIIVVIVLIAVLGFMPYEMGRLAEKRVRQLSISLSKSPEMDISIKQYQRGWFSSKATFDISLANVKAGQWLTIDSNQNPIIDDTDNMHFIVNQRIYHGPAIFSRTSKGGIEFNLAQAVARSKIVLHGERKPSHNGIQSDVSTIYSKVVISLLGALHVKAQTNEISYINAFYQLALDANDVVANWNFSRDLLRQWGDFKADTVTYNVGDYAAHVTDFDTDYSYRLTKPGIWLGKMAFSFDELSMHLNKKPFLKVYQGSFSSASDTSGKAKFLTVEIRNEFKKIMKGNISYGPGDFYLMIKNLDMSTLATLSHKLQQASDPRRSQNEREIIMFSALPLWPHLIGQDFSWNLTTKVAMPHGDFAIESKAEVEKMQNGDNLTWFDIFRHLKAHVNITIPKTTLRQILVTAEIKRVESQAEAQHALMEQYQSLLGTSSSSNNNNNSNSNKNKNNNSSGNNASQTLSQQQLQALTNAEVNRQINQWLNDGTLIQDNENYHTSIIFENGKLQVNQKKKQ